MVSIAHSPIWVHIPYKNIRDVQDAYLLGVPFMYTSDSNIVMVDINENNHNHSELKLKFKVKYRKKFNILN